MQNAALIDSPALSRVDCGRNRLMLKFIEWLRKVERANLRNAQEGRPLRNGSLQQCTHQIDPGACLSRSRQTRRRRGHARRRYGCFDHLGEDPQTYGFATTRGNAESCKEAVVASTYGTAPEVR